MQDARRKMQDAPTAKFQKYDGGPNSKVQHQMTSIYLMQTNL
jgi:hypothetical protein